MIHDDRFDCRNCGAQFSYNKTKIRQRDYGGSVLASIVCPYCDCTEVSKYSDRLLLERFIFPNEYADYHGGCA